MFSDSLFVLALLCDFGFFLLFKGQTVDDKGAGSFILGSFLPVASLVWKPAAHILIKSYPCENVGLLITLSTRWHPFIFVAFDPEITDKLSMKDKRFVSLLLFFNLKKSPPSLSTGYQTLNPINDVAVCV